MSDPKHGMFLKSLVVERFRSCFKTNITLRPDLTLIVGENNAGKSNVIDALRLATSPLSGRRQRYFEETDFTHGFQDTEIVVSTTFEDLTEIQRGRFVTTLDFKTLSSLYKTRFKIRTDGRRSLPVVTVGPADGPDAEPELREQICHVYLAPLRDAQRELDSSESLRLANVIEILTSKKDQDDFVTTANEGLKGLEEHEVIKATTKAVDLHVKGMTGPVREQSVGIGFTDYRLRRLARGLRMKMAEAGIDLASIVESGLGYANLTFIGTVLLELQHALDAELTLFLVEEPEAHLHPQLQAVLLEYLLEQSRNSLRDDTDGPAGRIQIVATTHSPNLASSVPIENVVVLKTVELEDGGKKVRNSHGIPVAELGLQIDESRKIAQYLDVTKASLLFAQRVVLVEGIAEAILIPPIARKLVLPNNKIHPIALTGVTLIPIGGVDFKPYLKLLLCPYQGHSILDRTIVITDRDPLLDPDPKKAQPTRAEQLTEFVGTFGDKDKLLLFESARTLEADLMDIAVNRPLLESAYLEQHPRSKSKWDEVALNGNPAEKLYEVLQSDAKFLSKGEFAHSVGALIESGTTFQCPEYLEQAIVKAVEGLKIGA